MRGQDSLSPSPRTAIKPTKIFTFDIETIGWTEPYLVGWYDGKEYRKETGPGCMNRFLIEALKQKYEWGIWYAHNGGKFDFNHLLKAYGESDDPFDFEVDAMRIGASIAQIVFRKGKHKWTMRDSVKLLPFTLRKLTANVGVTEKGEFDHTKVLNWASANEHMKEATDYNYLDCKGLYEALEKHQNLMVKEYGVNLARNITAPSVSKDVFRRNYLKTDIPSHKAAEDDIRAAYFGGRVEIFRTVAKEVNVYDVNSLYPYVMANFEYPVGPATRTSEVRITDEGFARATVTIPHGIIPPLPYRAPNRKLLFPVGTWTGWFAMPELRLAQSKGCTVVLHEGWIFETAPLFTEYVKEQYAIRTKFPSGTIENTMAKLNLNSLYGKFGQRREKKQYRINPHDPVGWTPMGEYGSLTLHEKDTVSESGHILPAIAAYVTAYARCHLYTLLDGNDPVYCDTDSVTTARPMHTGHELGALKLEKEISEGYYLLPKFYAGISSDGTEYVRSKGFPAGTFTFAQIKHAVLSGDNQHLKAEQERLLGIMEGLRRTKQFAQVGIKRRSVKASYDKRTVNGIETLPIEITNIDTGEQ